VFGVVTLLQPLAFWQLHESRNSLDAGGVFASFFWAIVIWSWIETSYYTGFIVGRKNVPEVEPGLPTWQRFKRAIAANLYHELMIIGLSIAVIIAGVGGVNETGLWAFMILHWTHQSAKINIFLGVNNLTTEYLPENLRYMAQYFVKKPLNSFFPVSVTISTIIATVLFASVLGSRTAGEQTGQALLFILMSAAVLEHWWLVTPVPSRVWEWALKSRKEHPVGEKLPAVQVVCGYLGSGKTTLIRHLLPQFNEKVAVLVNDFGAVGIDAELIKSEGAAGMVVELPGGCVCCTLQKNLTAQLAKVLETYRPERVIIEPSGVAGIEAIVKALAHPRLVGNIGPIEVVAVVEAPRLLAEGELPEFITAQVKVAGTVVISKTDLVPAARIPAMLARVSHLNHEARVIKAVQGVVSISELTEVRVETEVDVVDDDHYHNNGLEESVLISFGQQYEGEFDPLALRHFFDLLRTGHFGPVLRAKGIFHAPGARIAWDLAGGQIFERVLPVQANVEVSTSRFMLVAEDLTTEELETRLQACLIKAISH
jgi:putative photosynthetic complex assembly protein 2